MNPLEIIATILSLTGSVLIIYKNRWGFAIWIVANILWVIFALINKHYFMAILFLFYIFISIWGFVKWKKNDKKGGKK